MQVEDRGEGGLPFSHLHIMMITYFCCHVINIM